MPVRTKMAIVAALLFASLLAGMPAANATVPRLMGATLPGLGPWPSAEVVRVFQDTPRASLGNIPAGKTVIVSFFTMPSITTFKSVLASWKASGRTIWWAYHHEADGSWDPITPAQYQARYKALLDAWEPMRGSTVHVMTILTANLLRKGGQEAWYVPRVQALGFDVYYANNVDRMVAYAHTKGKPLAIPEWGNETGDHGWQGDGPTLEFAKAVIAKLDSNVFAACWFSHDHNDLRNLPKTLAYLKSLV